MSQVVLCSQVATMVSHLEGTTLLTSARKISRRLLRINRQRKHKEQIMETKQDLRYMISKSCYQG